MNNFEGMPTIGRSPSGRVEEVLWKLSQEMRFKFSSLLHLKWKVLDLHELPFLDWYILFWNRYCSDDIVIWLNLQWILLQIVCCWNYIKGLLKAEVCSIYATCITRRFCFRVHFSNNSHPPLVKPSDSPVPNSHY